ncbi:hypothetical protein WS67_01100 [Burkholderia singularis]|uniref:DUF1521 domain-containing protein n=1 Tax=Burkholderia singularis TaxID=1503053 RepID=A0A103DWV3_9BURK|nr:hypothetical protein [Burkholderia singularis]KVE24193.1 hypothetical protein WS67_01100 [Burkholderia singularis]
MDNLSTASTNYFPNINSANFGNASQISPSQMMMLGVLAYFIGRYMSQMQQNGFKPNTAGDAQGSPANGAGYGQPPSTNPVGAQANSPANNPADGATSLPSLFGGQQGSPANGATNGQNLPASPFGAQQGSLSTSVYNGNGRGNCDCGANRPANPACPGQSPAPIGCAPDRRTPEIQSSLSLKPSKNGYSGSASMTTHGGYRIEANQPANANGDSYINIYGPDGKKMPYVWGDPHITYANGKGNTFKGSGGIQLPDGSHILMNTVPDPTHPGQYRVKDFDVVDQNASARVSNLQGGGDLSVTFSRGNGKQIAQNFYANTSRNNLQMTADGRIIDLVTMQDISNGEQMDNAKPLAAAA